jgi:hypothetical protein
MPQLIGVACLTSLNKLIFKNNFYNFKNNLECAPANPIEKHYLLFLDLSMAVDYIEDDEIYLLIEVISIQPMCHTPNIPVGICVLQDKKYADAIFERRYFTNQDILDNKIIILWFEQAQINSIISNVYKTKKSLCQFITDSQCLPKTSKLSKTKTNLERSCPILMNRFYYNYWSLLEKSTQWLNSHIVAKNRIGQYLLFSLRFRENRNNSLDVHLMSEIINLITQNMLDSDINMHDSTYDINAFFVWYTKTHVNHIKELKGLYSDYQYHIIANVNIITKMIFQPINDIRQSYREFSLWTSEKIRNIIESIYRETPAVTSTTNEVINFGHLCMKQLTTTFDRNFVFSSIYEKAQFVIDKDQPLKLYGNFDSYLQQNGGKPFTYTIQNIGTLSNEKVLPIRCNFLDASFSLRDVFPMYSSYSAGEKKILENEYFLVPLWSIPTNGKNDGRCFYRLVPSSKKNGTDIMTQLDHIFNRTDNFLEECIQSNLHVSTLPFDLDVHLNKIDKIDLLVADLHTLCNKIMIKIADNSKISEWFSKPLEQYTFISQQNEEQEKIGLHHYVILPAGLVFTVNAVREMAQILEEARHQYINTLGSFEIKGTVFDIAIYPVSKKNIQHPGKTRCFRFPYQSKKKSIIKEYNNKKQKFLQPIRQLLPHRDINPSQNIWKLCAHAPQLRAPSGERVLTGYIVRNIKNIFYMEDIKYMNKEQISTMTISANLQNKTNYIDIMYEINKIMYLFPVMFDLKASQDKLLTIMNDLWRVMGRKIFKKFMVTQQGTSNKRFNRSDIDTVYNANFVVKNNKITLDIINPHLCVRRPHRNYNSSVMSIYVSFAHSKCNFRFFQSGCFKASCQTSFAVLPPFLPINEEFIANCIRLEIQKYFEKISRLKCRINYGDAFVPMLKEDSDLFISLKRGQPEQKILLFVNNLLISHVSNIYIFYDLKKESITLYSCLLKISFTDDNNVVEPVPDWTNNICVCNKCCRR